MDVESLAGIQGRAVRLVAVPGGPLGGLGLERRAEGGIDRDRAHRLHPSGSARLGWKHPIERLPTASRTAEGAAGWAAVIRGHDTPGQISCRPRITGPPRIVAGNRRNEDRDHERWAEMSLHGPPGSSRETAVSRRSPRSIPAD
jgi:hypothetical protein